MTEISRWSSRGVKLSITSSELIELLRKQFNIDKDLPFASLTCLTGRYSDITSIEVSFQETKHG